MSFHRTIVAATCLAVALTVAATGAALSHAGRAAATQGCGSSTCPPSSPAAATETPTPTATTAPELPTVAPASIEPASSTPFPSATGTPTATAATPTPTVSPTPPGSLPYIIEGPPPQVIEQIRAGLVPNVTLADLARSQQNVLGAPALAAVAPLAPVGTPIVGTDHGVAILVQYADLAAAPGSTQASFQSMLFGTGPDSMRTYYRENSYNQYDIQGDVTNWVTVAHNQNWYADYDGVPNTTALCGYGDDYGCGYDPAHSTQTLIRDAVLAADPYVDFSAYAQGGVVRNLMIIHAGIGAEANSSCHTCPWSVAWGPSGPLVVDGVSIQSAFVAPEYTFTPGDSRIGVYAHEFGHLAFGLPDLYDGDYSSAGVGYWSLMGFGSWLNGGATPSHLDAWSKIHNGWLVPTVVAADGAVNIPAAETSATALKLWTNGAPGSEYFLVENRQQTGFDTYLPGNGLLIWHIDDSGPSNNADCHPHVFLVPADSGVSLPCAFGYGSTSSPWPGTLFRTNWNGATVPGSRAYSGAQTGVAVMSIGASGPIMTANVSVAGASLFNDNVANATDIVSPPFTETLNTTSATVELGEPNPCGGIGKTLWYRYTPAVSPPAPVELTIDTVGSDFDTVLAVYAATGLSSPPGGLSLVDCNDNTSGLGTQSRITFTATPGNVYYIQAGGAAAASGSLVFNADFGPPKGRISGTVVDVDANPVAGAQVWANSSVCCGSYGSAMSAADGSYTIIGLLPGDYTVYASATGYATQYYSGTYNYSEATPVNVSPSAETAGIDFVLEPAARISGIVTNELGTPIPGAWISANNVVCCDGGWAMTAPDGTYLLNTLAPGSYRVQASAPGFATEYYDDTYDVASATAIVATSGLETTGVDFALAVGAKISGTVTNALGTPIADAFVAADRDGGAGTGYTWTGPDGTYLIDTLPSGNFRVYASASGYPLQFYNGVYDSSAATLVSAASGLETTGIDFALLEGGKISGTITNALGTPIAGASVSASRDGGTGYGSTYTADDGTYLISSLPGGDYRVYASAPGHIDTYYDGQPYSWAATLVAVSNGVETTGINIQLPEGGKISGKITDLLGTPIAGAQVYANQSTGYGSGYASTGPDGNYLIDKLPPGNDYKVSAYAAGHLERFYGGAGDWSTATLVTVSGGIETTGIDIALPPGARISGTVRNWLGTPVAASVFAERADGAGSEYTITAPDGTYLLSSLPTGSYRVQANAEGYPTQYYNGAYDWTAATLVATTSGSETTGIDFALPEGGKISGTVRNALGTPIAGAQVSASRDGGGYGSTNAGADGTYVITALRPGNYRVRAGAPGYPSQYYDGTYDSSAATLVAANDGAETPGIDFALPEGGKISGTVTNALGTPIAGAQVYASWDGGGGYGYASTASDGTYQVTGLMPGDYRVSVWASGYASQYYNGTYDYSAATLVTVTGGGVDTPGIDFALPLTGKISGAVTNMLGTPIAGAYVYADSETCCSGNATTTAADGTYVIDGLAPINHRLRASAPGYATQYYDFTYDWSAASLVLVTSGGEASGFNFTLEAEAKISGTVTDNLGGPIAGAWVYATRDACCGDGSSPTAADGTYTIVGLPPGSYRVQASSTGYIPQYWDHVADGPSATLVPVSSGTETTAIDFGLMPTDPDNSSTPKDILAFPFTDNRDTAGASLEPGEPQPCGDIGATIWYRLYVPYSPPGSTSVTIDTAGSDFDTAVAVYTPDYSSASPPGGLTPLGCNATGYRSWQTFTADPGTTYYIQVGGQSGATGNLVVHAGVDADTDGLRDDVETNTGVYIAPSDTGTNPAVADTDGDACGDGHEVLHLGLSPVNEWDFYSVPAPALFASIDPLLDVKDNRVSAFDAQAIFAYYRAGASTGKTVYDQDLNGNAIPDGIEYDRSYAGPGMTGPPDGVVRAQDAQLAFAQFKKGYKC